MSAHGMIKTVMATQLAEAIGKDMDAGLMPKQISALTGTFGPSVSAWLSEVAQQFIDSSASAKVVCRGREHPGCNYTAICGTTCSKCGSHV